MMNFGVCREGMEDRGEGGKGGEQRTGETLVI